MKRRGIIAFLAYAAASLGLGQKKENVSNSNASYFPTSPSMLLLNLDGYADDDPVLAIRDHGREIQLYKRDIFEAFDPPKEPK